MISRIRVIALVGAGAISSAGICSLYLAYTLDRSDGSLEQAEQPLVLGPSTIVAEEDAQPELEPEDRARDASQQPRAEQAFLVAFLADANPQVRTLAAWGLVSAEETENGQQELLDFIRQERDPEVRIALYRFLQGQRSFKCSTLVELVRLEEEDDETWLASCDLLAGVVQSGSSAQTEAFFNETIVPKLELSALNGVDLHRRIAAIIALRRSGTADALESLRKITRDSNDPQVVQTASSAVRLGAVD